MNEDFVTVTQGSENFKLRQKNPSEEALIKNEDDMYERDHDILRMETIINNIKRELTNAE